MAAETSSVRFKKRRSDNKDNMQTIKPRKLNPVNTISYLQILGTGMDTHDTSPSVLLFFDKQRFIFNAGEGLQRYCFENKIKLSKINHIFLSRVCSETAGGLPGLLLTLNGIEENAGVGVVNLWGSSDLKYLVSAMQSFVSTSMVQTHCFGLTTPCNPNFSDPIVLIDDEIVRISAIRITPSDVSVIYVIELPEIKGKFDTEKAAALGLKPGPKFRALQLGKSVKSDEQNIMIHPRDVLGPSVPGPIVLIVDCPTLAHSEDLSRIQSLGCYYLDKPVDCIIHLTPGSVTKSDTYQDWMKRFVEAQHVMAGHEQKNIEIPILRSSAKISARFNYLCRYFFPFPGFLSLRDSSDQRFTDNLLKFHLRPKLGFDRSAIPGLMSSAGAISELLSEIPEIEDSAKQVMRQLCNGQEELVPSCLENITREEMEIVLLGTGSSKPSKHRNVSSIYINLFAKGGLLLDCGEGSLGQLVRRFGLQGADYIVRNLKFIWISHIHADHHAGLVRILSQRRKLLDEVSHEPLIVIGPSYLKRFLDAYEKLEQLDMQFLDCSHTTNPGEIPMMEKTLAEAGLESLVSVPVVHCPQAYGVVLKAISGWKLVYSGDTRPCPELIEAALGATVLIHEATFEDGMVEDAIAKRHSTTSEAIQVGESADAYRIILTHFSQRYPKMPVFDDRYMHKTCVGFDLMSVNLADLPVLPKVNPYFKVLFGKEEMADGGDDSSDAFL